MRILLVPALLAGLALAGCGSSGSASPTSTPALNHLHTIAIVPSNPNALYIGSHYHMYRTDDGGKTWKALTKQMMLSIVLNPAHPSTLFAVSLQHGLIKSTDGGAHWIPADRAIPKGNVTGVVIDPTTQVVFAYGAGIYRTQDGGAHWSRGLPGQSVASMATGAGGSVFAATVNGLYVSHDDGLHWSTVGMVANQPVIQVAAAGSVAYAVTPISLIKSADGGRSWSHLGKAPKGIEFIGVSPSDSNEIFAEVAGSGFKASYDGGTSWHNANSGIRDRNFNASTIRVAPSSPAVVYTGSWGLHFYASHDAGRHWSQTSTLVR